MNSNVAIDKLKCIQNKGTLLAPSKLRRCNRNEVKDKGVIEYDPTSAWVDHTKAETSNAYPFCLIIIMINSLENDTIIFVCYKNVYLKLDPTNEVCSTISQQPFTRFPWRSRIRIKVEWRIYLIHQLLIKITVHFIAEKHRYNQSRQNQLQSAAAHFCLFHEV